jgi:hypothetical protein
MSKTADLDTAIDTIQGWLSSAKTQKDKLAIADRLIRALALKYKHDTEGKGGKFQVPSEPATNGAAHAGSEPSH